MGCKRSWIIIKVKIDIFVYSTIGEVLFKKNDILTINVNRELLWCETTVVIEMDNTGTNKKNNNGNFEMGWFFWTS